MNKIVISSRWQYHFGTLVNLGFLLATSFMWLFALENLKEYNIQLSSSDAIVILGTLTMFWLAGFFGAMHHVNRRVYIGIGLDHKVVYGSLFGEWICEIQEVEDAKYLFANMCRVKIHGKYYYYYGSKSSAKLLNEVTKVTPT